MDSVKRLRETGSRPFDLPTHWIPEEDIFDGMSDDDSEEKSAGGDDKRDDVEDTDTDGQGALNDGDNCSGPGDVDGGAPSCDSSDDSDDDSSSTSSFDEEIDNSRQRRARGSVGGTHITRRQRQRRQPVRVGHFAFFTADEAPFLIGKVENVRTSDDGDDEVQLHWYSPSNAKIRNNAASETIDTYGKGVFAADYVAMGTGNNPRRRGKMEKDTDWEPVSSIVVSCNKLNGNGKKVPGWVLAKLRVSSKRKREESSDEEE